MENHAKRLNHKRGGLCIAVEAAAAIPQWRIGMAHSTAVHKDRDRDVVDIPSIAESVAIGRSSPADWALRGDSNRMDFAARTSGKGSATGHSRNRERLPISRKLWSPSLVSIQLLLDSLVDSSSLQLLIRKTCS